MTLYALVPVVPGLVLSHADYPESKESYPDIAAHLYECPADIQDGWWFDGKAFAPLPAEVPQEVTMVQARLALLERGILSGVEDAIAALPEPLRSAAQIEWEFRPTVRRTSALTQQIAKALALSDEQVDALFVRAATL